MNEERDKVPNDIPAITSERARKHEHTNGPASAAFRNAVAKISTEYRLQFAWPREGEEHLTNGKPPAGAVIPEPGLGPPRKSISMGTIKPNQSNIAPVHRKRNTEADKKDGQSEAEPLVTENKNEDLREYKTEYKKKFRPFSHYDYVGGRFLQKEAADENKNEVSIPTDSTWYKEVLELRKKADEYKHRGWGVELLGESEADNKRLALWEQVLCRSSLSALSLASTTPRPGAKDEKATKKVWPTRTTWSRTTTPHQRDRSVTQNKEERSQSRVRSARDNAAKLHIRSAAGRSKSVDPGVTETKSPKRTPRSPVPQANAKNAKSSSEVKRPTTLTTTAPSRFKTSPSTKKSKDDIKDKSSAAAAAKNTGQPVKKKVDPSKKDAGNEKKEDEEPTSLIDEPIVKSPPEPTRVKSPEQMMMRSPEPVNWTVPLDTGKTFTVTQNVQGEALARLQGESIPTSTTPPVHSQVSSGNSLSLESLEVCKIMDLSFSNDDNLEHHFEPLNVSSPIPRQNEDQTKTENEDLCQTEFEINSVSTTETSALKSKRSVSSSENLAEVSDFEKFNNVHVDFEEKGLVENQEHEKDDFETSDRQSAFNDSGFEKEEERHLDFSEPASPEEVTKEDVNESLMEKDTNSNGNISEGYASVDKSSNEMNDSFNSSNYDEVHNEPKLNIVGGPQEEHENTFLKRSNSDLSEIGNQSLGKYSIDDETDSSFKLDTGHFNDLEHESIFTKEDLMSDKNTSSLDGSEINYPLSAKFIGEKSDTFKPDEPKVFMHTDNPEANDDRDSDSIDSVVDASINVSEELKKEYVSEELKEEYVSEELKKEYVSEELKNEYVSEESKEEYLSEELKNEYVREQNDTLGEVSVDAEHTINPVVETSPNANEEHLEESLRELKTETSERNSNECSDYETVKSADESASSPNARNFESLDFQNSETHNEPFEEKTETVTASNSNDFGIPNLEIGETEVSLSLNVNSVNEEVSEFLEKSEETVPDKILEESELSNPKSHEFEETSSEKDFKTEESELFGESSELINNGANQHHESQGEIEEGKNIFDNLQANEKLDEADQTDQRYAVVSTTGFEENPENIKDVEPSINKTNSSFIDSIARFSPHDEENDHKNDLTTKEIEADTVSSTSDFETLDKYAENDHNFESVIVPNSVYSAKEDLSVIIENDRPVEMNESSKIESPVEHNSFSGISQTLDIISSDGQDSLKSNNEETSSFKELDHNSEPSAEIDSLSKNELSTEHIDNEKTDQVSNDSNILDSDLHVQKTELVFKNESEAGTVNSHNFSEDNSVESSVNQSSDIYSAVKTNGHEHLNSEFTDVNGKNSVDEDDDSILNYFSNSGFPSMKVEENNTFINESDKSKDESKDLTFMSVVDEDETSSHFGANKISSEAEILKVGVVNVSVKSDTVLISEELKTNGFDRSDHFPTGDKDTDSDQMHIFPGGTENYLSVEKQPISVQNFFSDFKSIYGTEHVNGENIQVQSPSAGSTNIEFEITNNANHS